MVSAIEPSVALATHRRSRRLAFSLTWLAYGTYYLGRKGFSVVKKPMGQAFGIGEGSLGAIDTAFLAAYSLGQFANGWLGDRIGARRLVGYGMLASAAACAAFGSMNGALGFGICFLMNGLAQSTGWPGTTRAMAEWTTPSDRGTVMGLWSTCYQVGGIAATWIASGLAERYGWRSVFEVPALVIAVVGVLVLTLLPTRTMALNEASVDTGPIDLRSERRAAQRAVVSSPTLWLYGSSYFFIKLIRYSLLFWLPYYLTTAHGYSTAVAGRLSSAFDAGGVVGVIVIGRLSDRSMRATLGKPGQGMSRPALCALWLCLLALSLGAYYELSDYGTVINALLLGLVGAMLFGPDALLSGAASQDVGGALAPSMATGFVNGVGSIGALVQGLVVPSIARHFGWAALFPVLVGLALCAAAVLIPTLRGPKPVAP